MGRSNPIPVFLDSATLLFYVGKILLLAFYFCVHGQPIRISIKNGIVTVSGSA